MIDVHRTAPGEGPVESADFNSNGWNEIILPQPPAEAILLGDFNMSFESAEYDLLVGPKSETPNQAKEIRLAGFDKFVDAWVVAGNREEDGVSLPLPGSPGSGARIDYAFVTPSLAKHVSAVSIDPDADGSDHQPLVVEFKTTDAVQ